ncbi:uncharacterized protein KD926_007632 [Aspergillus affinis]|uniref:uncharacterized protein n=1 Tax=Aspergillus affinis TaxID=1070780 RepID=UPI0022FF2363|nr:uncharacterized protein KD926_007632 [Aspergillus affinis]KAI9040824.1 hypothetical protein KD926_007632 [Aspergillus affinis]
MAGTTRYQKELGLPSVSWRGKNAAWPLHQGFHNAGAKSMSKCANPACKTMSYPYSSFPDGVEKYKRAHKTPDDPLSRRYLCGVLMENFQVQQAICRDETGVQGRFQQNHGPLGIASGSEVWSTTAPPGYSPRRYYCHPVAPNVTAGDYLLQACWPEIYPSFDETFDSNPDGAVMIIDEAQTSYKCSLFWNNVVKKQRSQEGISEAKICAFCSYGSPAAGVDTKDINHGPIWIRRLVEAPRKNVRALVTRQGRHFQPPRTNSVGLQAWNIHLAPRYTKLPDILVEAGFESRTDKYLDDGNSNPYALIEVKPIVRPFMDESQIQIQESAQMAGLIINDIDAPAEIITTNPTTQTERALWWMDGFTRNGEPRRGGRGEGRHKCDRIDFVAELSPWANFEQDIPK